MQLTNIHVWNGLLVIVANLVVGVWAWRRSRSGDDITAGVQAGIIVAQLVLLLQGLIGIMLVNRGFRMPFVHYGAGLLPVLLYLGVYWFYPQLRGRRSLALAVASLGTFVIALMAYGIGEMAS